MAGHRDGLYLFARESDGAADVAERDAQAD